MTPHPKEAEAALTVLSSAARRLSAFAVKVRRVDRLQRQGAAPHEIQLAREAVSQDRAPDEVSREISAMDPNVEIPAHRIPRLLSLQGRLKTVADWLRDWGEGF